MLNSSLRAWAQSLWFCWLPGNNSIQEPRRHSRNNSEQASRITASPEDFFCCCCHYFWPPWGHMDLLGQGSSWSHSLDLSLSWGNPGSLTHCTGQGSNPHPSGFQDTTYPVAPQQELPRAVALSYNILILGENVKTNNQFFSVGNWMTYFMVREYTACTNLCKLNECWHK